MNSPSGAALAWGPKEGSPQPTCWRSIAIDDCDGFRLRGSLTRLFTRWPYLLASRPRTIPAVMWARTAVKPFASISLSAAALIATAIAAAQVRTASGAAHATFRGTTSQHKRVEITIDRRHDLTALTIDIAMKCTDQHMRSFTIAFPALRISPADADGNVTGSLDGFAGSFFSGSSYSEHASFSAHSREEDAASLRAVAQQARDVRARSARAPRDHAGDDCPLAGRASRRLRPRRDRSRLDLLGSILQRAFEDGQIQTNPARAVHKAPRPRRAEVRPLPPVTIERMRAASTARDAALISVLAYAGLRPGEALALQWRDIREQTVLVERAVSLGEEKDTKTAAHRTVRLLPPLAADLREWRLRSGRPGAKTLIFPSTAGTVWSQPAYQSWRRRAFKRSLDGAGVEHARPYDLRHSFASLLLHEGRTVIYVARQLGHDARLTLTTYGHVMDEFEDAPQLDAHTAIADARAALANDDPKRERRSRH
jgi:integrase